MNPRILRDTRVAFFPDKLSTAARIATSIVTLLGILIFAYSVYRATLQFELTWFTLVMLTGLAGNFTVTLPILKKEKHSVSVAMGDVFVFLAIFFYGPYIAVLASAAEGISMNLRAKVGATYKRLFNIGQLSLVSFLIGHLFYLLEGLPNSFGLHERVLSVHFILAVVVCALAYFLVNTGIVSITMGLSLSTNIFGV